MSVKIIYKFCCIYNVSSIKNRSKVVCILSHDTLATTPLCLTEMCIAWRILAGRNFQVYRILFVLICVKCLLSQ